ncbi:DUF4145 domain-containing protein [Vibrio metschnikovii]|uniref:DUF4145 domain-containing protein n=5 Tax=Bacteria TaxID=2 RepID=A0A9X0RCH0_VIBME|nr:MULTISPECIES: hypothetical protein [Vibrio]EKO3558515.1 DUF4145 domain-containing protein [Vibrio metschnikovii]EKO3566759.1 DUF4145 domain-containing protein [Vibrio metschnikovii]EKO3569400.1 DUF4145 domain-containing protein [Vibrio metschnikovii]EKO3573186.1 DUF4145 domain-containing protein [Vibrio metschnikovii]EKO3576591.1 DUF4145 domain-containing protein [Vibrio metschnikovii]
MSEIEQVVLRTRRLETLLRQHYHAQGKGLHQLISSCEERLPHDIIEKLRYIATIRNKIVHEDHFHLPDRKAFLLACLQCEKELAPRSGRFIWRVAVMLMLLMTMAAVTFYYLHWDELSKFFPHFLPKS